MKLLYMGKVICDPGRILCGEEFVVHERDLDEKINVIPRGTH